MISRSQCGSTATDHRAYKCRACNSAYQRKYRAAKRAEAGPDPNAPSCTFCGLMRGNGKGVKVYRYALIRPVKLAVNVHTNRCIASIAICDACLVEQTIPSPGYTRAHGLTERKWPKQQPIREDGLRAINPASLAS